MNADGTGFHRLNINNLINGYYSLNRTPNFSPDKNKIVFTSNRDGDENDFDIYIMNTNGSNIQKITNDPSRSEEFVSFSPNGQKLLYTAQDVNNNYQLYTSNIDGTNEIAITNFSHSNPFPTSSVRIQYPSWSKDGAKIVFCSDIIYRVNYNVFLINADGSNLVAITTHSTGNGRCQGPRLSPDGSKIAYNWAEGNNGKIYLIHSDGSNNRLIADFSNTSARIAAEPAWSPDGSYIAFVSNKDKTNLNDGLDIYVMRPDGTNIQRYTNINSWKAFIDWK